MVDCRSGLEQWLSNGFRSLNINGFLRRLMQLVCVYNFAKSGRSYKAMRFLIAVRLIDLRDGELDMR